MAVLILSYQKPSFTKGRRKVASQTILEENWRMFELVLAGYPQTIAGKISRRPDIDLHEAVHLLEKGCDPKTAFRILR